MRPDIRERFRQFAFPRDQRSRNQLYVFLVCIGLSIFIWTLIKLSEENISEISYPVKLVNLPEGKVLVKGDNQRLTLSFEEKASDIFFLRYIKKKQPVTISLANIPLKKAGSKYTGVIFPSHLIDYIGKQQELPYNIISLSPDTLRFVFEDRISKKVPVIRDVTVSLSQQRMLYDSVRIIPDSITISGPVSSVRALSDVRMEPVVLDELTDSVTVSAKVLISAEYPMVTADPGEVEIMVPVEEFTEARSQVRVKTFSKNFRKIKTFPETVELSYWVALADYNKVNPSMFTAIADIDSAIENGHDRAQVILQETPGQVRNLRISPEKVEYIIIRQ